MEVRLDGAILHPSHRAIGLLEYHLKIHRYRARVMGRVIDLIKDEVAYGAELVFDIQWCVWSDGGLPEQLTRSTGWHRGIITAAREAQHLMEDYHEAVLKG